TSWVTSVTVEETRVSEEVAIGQSATGLKRAAWRREAVFCTGDKGIVRHATSIGPRPHEHRMESRGAISQRRCLPRAALGRPRQFIAVVRTATICAKLP